MRNNMINLRLKKLMKNSNIYLKKNNIWLLFCIYNSVLKKENIEWFIIFIKCIVYNKLSLYLLRKIFLEEHTWLTNNILKIMELVLLDLLIRIKETFTSSINE